ncbi:hypothetical protein Mapa_004911 [Marchantia paleacea]|nr:hypothetical protein Mapa_004911 [Marchantia paleacea]
MWRSKLLCVKLHEAAPKILESAVRHLESGDSPITTTTLVQFSAAHTSVASSTGLKTMLTVSIPSTRFLKRAE